MFQDKGKEIEKIERELAQLEERQKEAIDRFQQEKSKYVAQRYSLVKEMCFDFELRLDKFCDAPALRAQMARGLLEDYCAIASVCEPKAFIELSKRAQVLLDYFFETEDVASIEKFLKYRSGSFKRQEHFDVRREKYMQKVKTSPQPQYHKNVEYVLSYYPERQDIGRLMMLCGKLDGRRAPKDAQGVYYSPQSQRALISASIEEFGSLAHHVYGGGEFDIYEYNRESLMYWHDQAFQAQQAVEEEREI